METQTTMLKMLQDYRPDKYKEELQRKMHELKMIESQLSLSAEFYSNDISSGVSLDKNLRKPLSEDQASPFLTFSELEKKLFVEQETSFDRDGFENAQYEELTGIRNSLREKIAAKRKEILFIDHNEENIQNNIADAYESLQVLTCTGCGKSVVEIKQLNFSAV